MLGVHTVRAEFKRMVFFDKSRRGHGKVWQQGLERRELDKRCSYEVCSDYGTLCSCLPRHECRYQQGD